MSAIFGLLHLNEKPVIPDDLKRMNAALAAHGADGGGIWTQGNLGLGQRLMRFTPEDLFERQPLADAEGQCVLVSAGRIDNRPELTTELEMPSVEARELPDSMFILRAYEKWGEDCACHIIGPVTFALWDGRIKRLLLVQSPVGAAPLFYYATPEVFAFATMARGLFSLPFVPREINQQYLADFLTLAPAEPGSSFFRRIARLQGGHSLVAGNGGHKVRRYWQPAMANELRLPRDDDYVEAFNELFGRVVSDHLRSLTPVGVMMSGGLDSTSVAAVAAPLLKIKGVCLATFTEIPRAGFDGMTIKGAYADETPFVQAMARLYDNIELNLVRTGGCNFLQGLERFFAAVERPSFNPSNSTWMEAILQQSRQQGARVILTGQLGNFSISWNGSGLLSQLLRQGMWLRALHEARALARCQNGPSTFRTLISQGVLPLLPDPLWLAVKRIRSRENACDPPWREYSAILPDFARAQRVDERAREKGHDFDFRLQTDTRLLRSKFILMCQDMLIDMISGYRAEFGVDLRDPTGDERIVGFCLSLPEEQYLRNGVSRRLIRRAMADRLPAEILANRGRGMQAADWFERMNAARSELFSALTELEQSQLARRSLDLKRMRRLVEQMPQAGGDAARMQMDYRQFLERGLITGLFLRWFESGG
jgi:asparagine synthase (glutamine-hydrolysing)